MIVADFRYMTDNNKENNLIISPLGVVYSLEIIGNGADGETRQKLQQYLGISKIKPRVRHLINVKEPHFLHFEA